MRAATDRQCNVSHAGPHNDVVVGLFTTVHGNALNQATRNAFVSAATYARSAG
jgi:hypothetical protein